MFCFAFLYLNAEQENQVSTNIDYNGFGGNCKPSVGAEMTQLFVRARPTPLVCSYATGTSGNTKAGSESLYFSLDRETELDRRNTESVQGAASLPASDLMRLGAMTSEATDCLRGSRSSDKSANNCTETYNLRATISVPAAKSPVPTKINIISTLSREPLLSKHVAYRTDSFRAHNQHL